MWVGLTYQRIYSIVDDPDDVLLRLPLMYDRDILKLSTPKPHTSGEGLAFG
jgi:hypothetical protein